MLTEILSFLGFRKAYDKSGPLTVSEAYVLANLLGNILDPGCIRAEHVINAVFRTRNLDSDEVESRRKRLLNLIDEYMHRAVENSRFDPTEKVGILFREDYTRKDLVPYLLARHVVSQSGLEGKDEVYDGLKNIMIRKPKPEEKEGLQRLVLDLAIARYSRN